MILKRDKESYGPEFNKHLFEQYKLYVEIADRVSARRMLANSLFITVHTALVTVFTFLLKENVIQPAILGVPLLLTVILFCFVWWRVIYSYRQLNSGKFKVINVLEEMLPIAPYNEEWIILGEGKDHKKYFPLTHIENLVPICFGLFYIILAVIFYIIPRQVNLY